MSDPASLPELFDLEHDDFADDLPLYEQLARRGDGPLLELGVGTGRIAIELARAGFEVWGIDSSEPMLERARCKAAGLDRLHLQPGDMRDFALDTRFALVFAGMGAFHHLLTRDDQLSCLRAVKRHLTPDGIFVCDLRPFLYNDWDRGASAVLFHDWTRRLDSGETVVKLRSVHVDGARQLQHETHIYDLVDDAGATRRILCEIDLRFVARYEMEGLLHESGLAPEGCYGDYDLAPFDETSEYMISIARSATSPDR